MNRSYTSFALLCTFLIATSIAAAQGGKALNLNGSSDYAEASSLPPFQTNSFTYEAWFYWNGPNSTDNAIFLHGAPDGPGLRLMIQASDSALGGFASNGTIPLSDTRKISMNAWHHVAVVRDSTWTIYLDGVGVTFGDEYPDSATAGVFRVGDDQYNNWFNGLIDEVRVSTVARYTGDFTPSAVPFADDDSTTLLWHLDGDGGDASGNGFTPTLQSSASYAASSAPLEYPIVTTNAASNILNYSATLNATITPGQHNASFWFEYGTSTGYGTVTDTLSPGNSDTPQDVFANIADLTYLTEYHYRVVSLANGAIYAGDDASFTTLPDFPWVDANDAGTLTSSTADVSAFDFPNGGSTTVYFLYGTSSGNYTDSVGANENPIEGDHAGYPVTATITGLTGGTTYYFIASVVSTGGYGRSTEHSFTLPEAPIVSVPLASGATTNSIDLSATVNPRGTSYALFEYGLTNAYGISTALDTLDDFGSALVFDQTGGRVDVPYSDSLNTSTFTYEAWARLDGGAGTHRAVLATGGDDAGIKIWADFSNVWQVQIGTGAAPSQITGPPVVEGAWTHFAVTGDGSTIRFYLNGWLIGSYDGAYVVNTTKPFVIGASDTNVDLFNGVIDEVRVWNTALDAGTLSSWKYRTVTCTHPNWSSLAAYWKMDENTGSILNDASGFNHTGALQNCPAWTNHQRIATITTSVNGLFSNATYHVRTKATNAAGTGSSCDVVFTTLTGPPTAETSEANGVGRTNATIRGGVHTNGSTTVASLQYGTSVAYGTIAAQDTLDDFGTALSLSDPGGEANTSNSLDLANASFTLEVWAKRLGASAEQYLVSQGFENVGGQGLHFGFRNPAVFTFAFWGNDIDVDVEDDMLWHHWAGTYDADTRERKVYRDGILVGSQTDVNSYLGSGTIHIGKAAWGGSQFVGQVDEVRIWGCARTQEQINSMKNRAAACGTPGLRAYWSFNENTGTTAGDHSGNGLNACFSGTATWISNTDARVLTAKLTGLTPGTTYHFAAVGMNCEGTGTSDDRTFTTPVHDFRSYDLSASSQPFQAIYSDTLSPPTVVSSPGNDDEVYPCVNVGFDFWYLGQRYNKIAIVSNGWITFDANSSSTSYYPDLSDGPASGSGDIAFPSSNGRLQKESIKKKGTKSHAPVSGYLMNAGTRIARISDTPEGRPLLAPFWSDLYVPYNDGVSGIAYRTEGCVPNRIFVVEWYRISSCCGSYEGVSFQVRLHENGGKIEFAYHRDDEFGSITFNSHPPQVGITAPQTGSENFVGLTDLGVSPGSTTANTTGLGNTFPASDQVYTFTPQQPAAPSDLIVTVNEDSTVQLAWTNHATNATGYAVYQSDNDYNYTYVTTVAACNSSYLAEGISNPSSVFWAVYAVNDALSSPLTTGTVLPVELAAFSAVVNRFDATLKWKTMTETENAGFEIERRSIPNPQSPIGNSQWSKVAFVAGAGTSTSPHDYSFTDRSAAPGRNAYRLKQIDKAGAFKYSSAVEVEVGLAPKEFTLSQNYPNPFNPSTTVEFTLPEDGRASLKVYNMLGQEVATLMNEDLRAGYYQRATFDASRMATGLYIARLEFNGKQLLKKMLLVK